VTVLLAAELLLVSAAAVACIGPVGQAIRADPVDILRSN
jgi:hypothetical protein